MIESFLELVGGEGGCLIFLFVGSFEHLLLLQFFVGLFIFGSFFLGGEVPANTEFKGGFKLLGKIEFDDFFLPDVDDVSWIFKFLIVQLHKHDNLGPHLALYFPNRFYYLLFVYWVDVKQNIEVFRILQFLFQSPYIGNYNPLLVDLELAPKLLRRRPPDL